MRLKLKEISFKSLNLMRKSEKLFRKKTQKVDNFCYQHWDLNCTMMLVIEFILWILEFFVDLFLVAFDFGGCWETIIGDTEDETFIFTFLVLGSDWMILKGENQLLESYRVNFELFLYLIERRCFMEFKIWGKTVGWGWIEEIRGKFKIFEFPFCIDGHRY